MNPRPLLQPILEAALAAVEPGNTVRRCLSIDDGTLRLASERVPLADVERILVVGAGKASAPMAGAVEEVLAGVGRNAEGTVIVRYGHVAPTRHVRIVEAGHPVPDSAGVSGTRAIVDLLRGAGPGDLVICLISGGGSALLTLPAHGISLDDIQQTTDVLLRSGATIQQVNTIRKHLDVVKGGGLARLAAPARVLTLILSDVVGNPLDVIASGPTVPDSTTWRDAAAILDRFELWSSVPRAVVAYLQAGMAGRVPDTPKSGDPAFERTSAVIVGSNRLACEAACARAEALGLRAMLLTTFVEGEAREVARVLAAFVREVDASGAPLGRPCCLVAGGETTVTLRCAGKGGRNQELALTAAWPLQGLRDVLLASIGTDGIDGPTDAAGAQVDGQTLTRANALGLDPGRHLAENDAYPFFAALGDLVVTGPTNTNVNDLFVLLAT